MTVDLETRLTRALADAAAHLPEPNEGLTSIVQRQHASGRPCWITAGALATAVAAVAVGAVLVRHDNTTPPVLATAGMPGVALDAWECGNVSYRDPTPDERAGVDVPLTPPSGYGLASGPTVATQMRAASTPNCWEAAAVYADSTTGRLLTAALSQQGVYDAGPCTLGPDYQPASCTTVNGLPASRTNEGTRSTIQWVTRDGAAAAVSGFGLTAVELDAVAASLRFDGSAVTITPPEGMTVIADQARTRTDDATVVRSFATYRDESGGEVYVTISAGEKPSFNLVGPVKAVVHDNVDVVVVTTGGAGIVQWGSESSSAEAPARAYATWSDDDRTVRIEGPDAETVARFVAAFAR